MRLAFVPLWLGVQCGKRSSVAFPGWLEDRRQQTVGDLALLFVLPLSALCCLPILIRQLPSDALGQGLLKVASFPLRWPPPPSSMSPHLLT